MDLERRRKSKQDQNQEGEQYDPIVPRPSIASIKNNGLVQISFNTDMNRIPDPSLLKNLTVSLEGKEVPVFQVEVVPGSESDPFKMSFSWEVKEMSAR